MPRIISPLQFVFCAVLFFLPWVEVQCAMPDLSGLENIGKPEAQQKKTAPKAPAWKPFLSQTGLQIATGKYTMQDPTMKGMMEMAEEQGAGQAQSKEDDMSAAPLAFAVLGAAVLGAVFGLVLPYGLPRKALLVLCCLVAVAVPAKFLATGFPVEADIKKSKKLDAGGGAAPGGADAKAVDQMFRTVVKLPVYLCMGLAAGAGLAALVEPMRKRPTSAKPKRDSDDDDRFGDDEPRDDAPRDRA